MSYLLLTGATGLLGNYLLRDLLLAGRPVAVVARRSRLETARQRIDSILCGWERELGRALARPPVLEGDICLAGLGLDEAALNWIAAHCDAVLHNAASLSFDVDEKTGEPERTNITGTSNVLELCRRTGIREFHQVSTAYVCGLRTGIVREDEVDVGQTLGNAYERSKLAAEKMVRAAEYLDRPTFYRPAIIIGDSTTGYTTTFHGFYTPLKIVHAFFDATRMNGAPLMAALDLGGHERKNYVPVDWVSQVITHLVARPECRGQTYHLTPRQAAPMSLTCQAIEQALAEHSGAEAVKSDFAESLEFIQGFTGQMETYRAYWRDDPDFDARNTFAAAPHLPCPDVDLAMLVRTARYALGANFGWPRPQIRLAECDILEHVSGLMPVGFEPLVEGPAVGRAGLVVNGEGGGQWTMALEGGRALAARWGLDHDEQALIYLNSKTFQHCAQRVATVLQAHQRGEVVAQAPLAPGVDELLDVLEDLMASAERPLGQPSEAIDESAVPVVEGGAW